MRLPSSPPPYISYSESNSIWHLSLVRSPALPHLPRQSWAFRQYKARGPLTDNLLAVVAIDDALCLIAFGIAMAFAKVLSGKVSGGLAAMIVSPLWELLGSLLLGAVTAVVLLLITTRLKELPDRLVVVLGVLFALAGTAELLQLSSLLACMAMGCVAVNILPGETDRLFSMVKSVDTPIYVLFLFWPEPICS